MNAIEINAWERSTGEYSIDFGGDIELIYLPKDQLKELKEKIDDLLQ